jgi:hypothetical protein
VNTTQINPRITEVVELPGSCAKIHGATKIRILFFYPSIVGYSRGEENRQLGKLHLTLNLSFFEGHRYCLSPQIYYSPVATNDMAFPAVIWIEWLFRNSSASSRAATVSK